MRRVGAVAASAETEDRGERCIDSPQLLRAQMTAEVTEERGIDGAELLDEHPGRLTFEIDLGAE